MKETFEPELVYLDDVWYCSTDSSDFDELLRGRGPDQRVEIKKGEVTPVLVMDKFILKNCKTKDLEEDEILFLHRSRCRSSSDSVLHCSRMPRRYHQTQRLYRFYRKVECLRFLLYNMYRYKVKELLAIAVFATACAGCISSDSDRLVQGNDWSFRAPSKGWWFMQRSSENDTILVGSSYYNVGSRPMNVALKHGCSESDHENFKASEDLGKATKWAGGRIGTLEAFKTADEGITFVVKVPQNKCVWTLTCEGDVLRTSQVEAICNTMVSSLEFHR